MLALPEERAYGAHPDWGSCEGSGFGLFVECLLSSVALMGRPPSGKTPVSLYSLGLLACLRRPALGRQHGAAFRSNAKSLV